METMSKQNSVSDLFWALLQILFIALKLTETIDWSWWWVLSPTLIPLGIVLAAVVLAISLGGLPAFREAINEKRKKR